MATFITALDNTVVNIALPAMQRDLRLNTSDLEWIASSYILAFASLMLAGGKLADRVGRRKVFLVGMVVFAVSSALAGAAPNGTVLIIMRGIQGLGGALVLPSSLAILASDVSDRERHLGVGLATASAASALALGPLVGGAITEYAHWSWVFYLNVPVVIATVLIGRAGLPKLPPADPDGHVDVPGFVLSGAAFCALTWGLIEGGSRGWGSPEIVGAFGVCVLLLALFVAAEFRAEQPMIDVALFRSKVYTGSTAAQFLWGLGINGVFFFTSLFLQNVIGFSPTQAGAAFIPLAVVLVLVVPFVTRVEALFGNDVTIWFGLMLVAFGLYLVSRVGATGGFLDLLPALVVIGVGSGLSIGLTSAALSVVPAGNAGMASAVLTATKEIAGVFGIVLTGAVLSSRESGLLRDGVAPADAFIGGYQRGLEVGALLSVVGAFVALITMRRVPRHRRRPTPTGVAPGRHHRLLDAGELAGELLAADPRSPFPPMNADDAAVAAAEISPTNTSYPGGKL